MTTNLREPGQEQEPSDGFSESERRALALWRAPTPPGDFVPRVMARLESEGGAREGGRGVFAAALALFLVGGLVTARLLSSGGAAAPGGAEVRFGVGDGGTAAEVSPVAERAAS